MPEVEAVVLVRPTVSKVLHRQMLGRGLRPSEGKTECVVLDHAGNMERHGKPGEEGTSSLRGEEKPPTDADGEETGIERGSAVIVVDGELEEDTEPVAEPSPPPSMPSALAHPAPPAPSPPWALWAVSPQEPFEARELASWRMLRGSGLPGDPHA